VRDRARHLLPTKQPTARVAFYILVGRRSLGSEPFGLNAVDKLDRTVFVVLLPDICDHFGRIEEVVGSSPITSTRGNPQRCR